MLIKKIILFFISRSNKKVFVMFDEKKLEEFKNLGIYLLSKEPAANINIIPTGSYLLDKALGIGGWPEGKIVELFGVDSSGKTTLALHAISEAQKLGKLVVYLDIENTINPLWAKKIGVDLSKVLISRPENGEKSFELLNKLVVRKDIGLIIVDSVASLVPSYEFSNSLEDQTMGLHARLMSKGLRVLQSLMINSKTTILFINQVREKIGNSFIPAVTTTGGRALKYAAAIRVEIKKCETIKDSSNVPLAFSTKITVVKNKYGAPLSQALTAIYFDSGFDIYYEIIQEAMFKKIFLKKGAWIEYQEKNIAQGLNQLRNILMKNESLFLEIKEKIQKLPN